MVIIKFFSKRISLRKKKENSEIIAMNVEETHLPNVKSAATFRQVDKDKRKKASANIDTKIKAVINKSKKSKETSEEGPLPTKELEKIVNENKVVGKNKKGKKVTALPWSLNENIWEDILNEEFLCADIMEKYGTDKNFLTPNESDEECKYLYERIKREE